MRRTEGNIAECLRKRYPANEWVFLTGVRNATGFGNRVRTADAVALNLWPSRGLAFHGFEIKSVRSDWLNELRQPEKAEEICRFMDYWWIVAGEPELVKPEEVPETWGHMVVNKEGVVKIIKQAVKLEAQPMPRTFICSLFKEVSAQASTEAEIARKVEVAIQAKMPEMQERIRADLRWEGAQAVKNLQSVTDELTMFKKRVGWDKIEDVRWRPAEEVARLIALVLKTEQLEKQLRNKLELLEQVAGGISRDTKDLLAKLTEVSSNGTDVRTRGTEGGGT